MCRPLHRSYPIEEGVLQTPSSAAFQNLDTTYDPLGLWLFNGDLNDSSGNGYHLSVAAGSALYRTFAIPGTQGLYLDGSTYLTRAVTAALNLLGDLTVQCLIRVVGSGLQSFLGHLANGEPEPTNAAYLLRFDASLYPSFLHEYGEGNNAAYTNSTAGATTLRDTMHLTMVRESNVISWYRNNSLLGAASGTLTAPSGGTSGFLHVGADDLGGNKFTGFLQSLKINDRALSAAERAAEFTRTGFTS